MSWRLGGVCLAMSGFLAGCGSITGGAPGDGAVMTAKDGGADAVVEAAREAGPDRAPDAPPDTGPPAVDAPDTPDVPADTDPRHCTVKINEVQTGGAASALDEFIELYNTCPDRPVPLAGYSLLYRSDTGTTNVLLVAFGEEVIAAGRPFFLCANGAFAGPLPDATYSNGLRDAGGGVALRAPDGSVVDSVGWG